jgi:uncharacterized protein (DUF433 family)
MNWLDRITVHPEICRGEPTVRGIRITVAFILKLVNGGHSVTDILGWYPMLEEEDILQALEYARTHPCEV